MHQQVIMLRVGGTAGGARNCRSSCWGRACMPTIRTTHPRSDSSTGLAWASVAVKPQPPVHLWFAHGTLAPANWHVAYAGRATARVATRVAGPRGSGCAFRPSHGRRVARRCSATRCDTASSGGSQAQLCPHRRGGWVGQGVELPGRGYRKFSTESAESRQVAGRSVKNRVASRSF